MSLAVQPVPSAPPDAVDFLRRHAPFDDIAADLLRPFAAALSLADFARDATILSAQNGPVEHLFIVLRGLVGRRPNDTHPELDRTLGPGDMFPIGALAAGAITTKVFNALADTTCYVAPRASFMALREASPQFEAFCSRAIVETLRQSLDSLFRHYSQRAAEQQTLTRTLDEVVAHPPVTCRATATLREAAQKMSDERVRTVIVVSDEGPPIGMLTLVDLLQRVVLPERTLDTPVREVMSTPIITLPGSVTAYEAMHVMAERGIRQVVVVEGGRVRGVVNERDLFALRRVSMRDVVEGLREAQSVEALKRAAGDIRRLTGHLLDQGVGALPLTRTIASLNDALTRRAIQIVLARHDLGGIDWCWLALGSEGRGEQTFATDQDNALLFACSDDALLAPARERLLGFARDVNTALDTLGFPLCTGNVMAGNPDLCLGEGEWKAKFLKWMREPTPHALLQANIVFDFRALAGNATLADSLRDWLLRYTQASNAFLRLMVQNALETDPPVGLIRTFAVDDDGPGKRTIDLKTRGTRLFVDCARVFALAQGIAETGTAARLALAGKALSVDARYVEATTDAFHFLQSLRLRKQAAGRDANRIDPYALNEVEQRMLREAFRQAKQLQDRLRLSYRL